MNAGRARTGLAAIVGDANVRAGDDPVYRSDATESRGLRGEALAVALPGSTDEVAAIVAWCDAQAVTIVPRGGGTGFAGGAVPTPGCVVVSLERMRRVRQVDPIGWSLTVEAGAVTADAKRLARQHGLWLPLDPGAAEQSLIGGNVATNAGGPHTLKYGNTGAWVTGVEAVVPPGRVVRFGGSVRKNVATLDLGRLFVGSEGTLGIVTAVTLRLIPPPECAIPVVALYRDRSAACEAILAGLSCGVVPATMEFLDATTLAVSRHRFPWQLPPDSVTMVVAEADGSNDEATSGAAALSAALGEGSIEVRVLDEARVAQGLWAWRDGVALSVRARYGGKAGEDVVVPVGQLARLLDITDDIAARYDMATCTWGHAGDGNMHANFMFDPESDWRQRVEDASAELFAAAVALGGSISGEHGVGQVKLPYLALQVGDSERELLRQVKAAFDPKGLMNPGKKLV